MLLAVIWMEVLPPTNLLAIPVLVSASLLSLVIPTTTACLPPPLEVTIVKPLKTASAVPLLPLAVLLTEEKLLANLTATSLPVSVSARAYLTLTVSELKATTA
jgi:hypothetical protein